MVSMGFLEPSTGRAGRERGCGEAPQLNSRPVHGGRELLAGRSQAFHPTYHHHPRVHSSRKPVESMPAHLSPHVPHPVPPARDTRRPQFYAAHGEGGGTVVWRERREVVERER
jgi:hypothetical protein